MAKRSSIERTHCSDQQGFTHGLVRATAKMERAKQLERKAERKQERAAYLIRKASIGFGRLGAVAEKAASAVGDLASKAESLPMERGTA